MSREQTANNYDATEIRVGRADILQGTLKLPGDKSISHRAAMLAAMAEGRSRIGNFATSEDCAATISCLRSLGVEIEQNVTEVSVIGKGNRGFHRPSAPLDCGNSGTTMRLMTGILAGMGIEAELTGDASLSKRPMGRIVGPLTRMEASVETTGGMPPIRIKPKGKLKAIDYVLPVPSAQVKSCVLLAGLNAEGVTTVVEPVATRDHTERMLAHFGVVVQRDETDSGRRVSVTGGSQLKAADILVPCDISSAAFFLVAGACVPGSQLLLQDVGLNPTRSAVIDVLLEAGIDLTVSYFGDNDGEPVGNIEVACTKTDTFTKQKLVLEGDVVANLIDELPILAVLGTQLPAGLSVRGAAELRVKETDRIAAVVKNLRKMGAGVEEFDDGFNVSFSKLKGARVHSFGDHRIAMAFAVAGLLADGETEIADAECVNVSFPGFFEVLSSLSQVGR